MIPNPSRVDDPFGVICLSFLAGAMSYVLIIPILSWIVGGLKKLMEKSSEKQRNQKIIEMLNSWEDNIISWSTFFIITSLIAMIIMYFRFCVQDGYSLDDFFYL